MWDQGCHLFEPAGRVMTDPHILSIGQLPAQRAGTEGCQVRCAVGRAQATGGYKNLV